MAIITGFDIFICMKCAPCGLSLKVGCSWPRFDLGILWPGFDVTCTKWFPSWAWVQCQGPEVSRNPRIRGILIHIH